MLAQEAAGKLPAADGPATLGRVTLEVRADGSVQVRDRFVFLRTGLLLSGLSFGGLGVALALGGSDLRSAYVPLAGLLACAAFAAVVEDSDFQFDAKARQVRWTKWRFLGRTGGTIPFEAIESIALEVRTERSNSGLSVTRDCRLFVVTPDGALALGSSNLDVRTAREKIAPPLLTLLGKTASGLTERGIGARHS